MYQATALEMVELLACISGGAECMICQIIYEIYKNYEY